MDNIDRFNELYSILEKIVKSKVIKAKGEKYHSHSDIFVPFWGETVIVAFKSKGGKTHPIVGTVFDNDGEIDYGYISGHEPHLKSWLMRPNIDRVIQELEKTIFILS